MGQLFYQPENGCAGDYIPFYWEGRFHLFYLRFNPATLPFVRGVDWWHVVTTDFIHFEEWGCALPAGSAEDQDMNAFTGSIFAMGDRFYLFYTGNNWDFADLPDRHREAVMLAVSRDLCHWEKIPDWKFLADTGHYEKNDWRDPFVCRQGDEFWMLLHARLKDGLPEHRGCTARAVSRDLKNWTVVDPLYSPGRFYAHECPDLFCMDGNTYLLFSDFSIQHETMYRMAERPDGPWRCARDPLLDSDGYYAAKTAGDDQVRFLFGWAAGRKGSCDAGELDWGGPLVVHQVSTLPDGSLALDMPESMRQAFDKSRIIERTQIFGQWEEGKAGLIVEADEVSGYTLFDIPEEPWLISFHADIEGDVGAFGLMVRYDGLSGNYYSLQFEPARGRLALVRIHNGGLARRLHERPIEVKPGQSVQLEVLVDGDCLVAYVDHRVALTARLYDFGSGLWGLFASGGRVRFRDLKSLNASIFSNQEH